MKNLLMNGKVYLTPTFNRSVNHIDITILFILGCGLVYSLLGILAAMFHGRGISDSYRRRFEAIAGFMLTAAAVKIATQVR